MNISCKNVVDMILFQMIRARDMFIFTNSFLFLFTPHSGSHAECCKAHFCEDIRGVVQSQSYDQLYLIHSILMISMYEAVDGCEILSFILPKQMCKSVQNVREEKILHTLLCISLQQNDMCDD